MSKQIISKQLQAESKEFAGASTHINRLVALFLGNNIQNPHRFRYELHRVAELGEVWLWIDLSFQMSIS